MADVTVGRAQHEEVIAVPSETVMERRDRSFPDLPGPLILLWTALVLIVVVFLAFGSLWVDAVNSTGRPILVRDLLVREIWSRFVGYLTDQGASAALVIAVSAAAAVALVAAGIALWLAFGVRDARSEQPADEPAGT